MYHFFKKHTIDLTAIAVDFHNHILPHIDDGADNTATSFLLRSQLQSWGINHCIYTPHIYKDIYPNTTSTIQKSHVNLMQNTAYQKKYWQDTFAAEYMVDEFLKEDLAKNKTLLCVKDNLLLIEFPTYFKSPLLDTILFDLFMAGYQPIIAHPERYVYYELKDYLRLKDMGCLFQINYLSISKNAKKEVKKNAEKLLSKNFVDYIATDLHNPSQLAQLTLFFQTSDWQKYKNYPFKNSQLTPWH